MWLLLVALLQCDAAPDADVLQAIHVRPVSTPAGTLLIDAITQSALINELIEHLTATDTFVYVELVGSPDIPTARTKLVSAANNTRFLRISINARTPFWDRVPLLAHELQHAIEIADDPDVRDDDGVRRLYSRIGFSGGGNKYETAAARQIERRVRSELTRRSAR